MSIVSHDKLVADKATDIKNTVSCDKIVIPFAREMVPFYMALLCTARNLNCKIRTTINRMLHIHVLMVS